MSLKHMSEYKRNDYTYKSPDGDEWTITIVQTEDRKYVEIKKGEEEQVNWDVEMLLDIADAIRKVSQQASFASSRKHKLKSPSIIDHRDKKNQATPADQIHAAVEESMENTDDGIVPVESFSRMGVNMSEDIARRTTSSTVNIPNSTKIKRRNS